MAKKVKKYYYNVSSNEFEKYHVPLRIKLLRLGGLLSAVVVTAFLLVSMSWWLFDSPQQNKMRKDLAQLNAQYKQLEIDYHKIHEQLSLLEKRDDQVYRAIFEAAPIHDDIEIKKLPYTANKWRNTAQMSLQLKKQLVTIRNRITLQHKSLDTIQYYIEAKEDMLSSIPAIIPVSYNQLSFVASGFGYRIDPVYKTPKLHAGIDFAGAAGAPIYATANGVIEETDYDEAGYGNHVRINHGYGYTTLYAHMSVIKAKKGQRVKRGEVIGYVGSTGKSTGPHCHYEVIRNGEKINPVHFFYNDLSPAEYEKIIAQATVENQSFD